MKIDRELSIKTISSFYSSLKNEMDDSNEVELDFTGVSRIDAAVAQVIISAVRKAREQNAVMHFTGISPELKKLMKLAGIKLQ